MAKQVYWLSDAEWRRIEPLHAACSRRDINPRGFSPIALMMPGV